MTPQPMAVKITEETYPIAIACLPAGFALYPLSEVLGCYLIINKLQIKHFGKKAPSILQLDNIWLQERFFRKSWKFKDKERLDRFSEIEKI